MTESVSQALPGETKIESPVTKYWNSKKAPAAKGDQVKGVFVRAEPDEYEGRKSIRHVLQGDDGEIVLPNHTILNGLMSKVPIGKGVRVVYDGPGEATKRGRSPPEKYTVFSFDVPASSQPPAQPPVQVPASDDTVITAIIKELKESAIYFKDGIIPTGSITACAAKHLQQAGKHGTGMDVFNSLKQKGLIIPKGEGYGVV